MMKCRGSRGEVSGENQEARSSIEEEGWREERRGEISCKRGRGERSSGISYSPGSAGSLSSLYIESEQSRRAGKEKRRRGEERRGGAETRGTHIELHCRYGRGPVCPSGKVLVALLTTHEYHAVGVIDVQRQEADKTANAT
eukprot:768668-Hanusia_phi.AAC.3